MSNIRQTKGMQTGDAHKNYQTYSMEEFLQDDFFIRSIVQPTRESESFWRRLIDEEGIDKDNYKMARNFIHLLQVDPKEMVREEIQALWKNIEDDIRYGKQQKKRRFRLHFAVVASIAALLVCGATLYFHPFLQKKVMYGSIENVRAPEAMADNILLILDKDETVSLEGKEAKIAYNAEGIAINNQETEWRKERKSIDKSTAFNQLIVPLGKRSVLTFAEGSRMWVNAGTRVVYPAVFGPTNREIYVDGEVFLEVAREEDRPFIVKTKKLNVEVLGTSFNVMAYEKDTTQNIVLVSGIVKVQSNQNKKEETILVPNEMYVYTPDTTAIKSVDINDYISWKSGIYQYESKSLDMIMERLSRYYGKAIECSQQVARLKCSGKLDLKDDIELVLKGISQTAPIVWRNEDGRYIITNQ